MLSDLSRAVTLARLIEPITASRSIGRTNLRIRLRMHATNRYTFVVKAPQTLTAVIDMVSLHKHRRVASGGRFAAKRCFSRKTKVPDASHLSDREPGAD